MPISPEAAQALLAVCQAFGIEQSNDRVWLVANGHKIVGLEASSATAATVLAFEAQRAAAVAAATSDE